MELFGLWCTIQYYHWCTIQYNTSRGTLQNTRRTGSADCGRTFRDNLDNFVERMEVLYYSPSDDCLVFVGAANY